MKPRVPSYEYELLHQFEWVCRPDERKTQAASSDYQRVWENIIDNPPADGVTPILVYRMNGEVCAAIAGVDDLADNDVCAMEIARLAARVKELEAVVRAADRYIGDAEPVICDDNSGYYSQSDSDLADYIAARFAVRLEGDR